MKEKILLASMILAIWLVVLLTAKWMPHVSSVILLLVFMSLYTWLITLAMVHQKRMEAKRPKPPRTDYLPKVSVVIAAHNEETVIEQTVRHMLRLDYPDFELLVMDDRSTDATPEILQRLGEEFTAKNASQCLETKETSEANPGSLPYRYHLRPEEAIPGKPAVLNEALTITDGEVICVFDADAYVEPDFLRKMIPFLADENVGAVQCRKVIANQHENWLTRCQEYEYSLDAHVQYGRDSVRGAVELRGNGQLVKREALTEVNGWNNNTLTDDLDLSTRLHIAGWDIRFAHKAAVYEEGITQFQPLLRQRRRWTEGTLFRYLEHAGDLLTSRKASMRTTLDMVAYFLEFLLPLWLALDFILLIWSWLRPIADPEPIRILSSLIVIPIFAIGIISTLIVAIIRFHRPPVYLAAFWGIVTGLYMTILWFPLVFAIMVKVLFQRKRRTRWDKTIHTGATHRPLTG